jgi:flagellar motor switch protein FliG
MELDEVDASEQQRVIEQFMGGDAARESPPPAAKPATSLDELSFSAAVPLAEYLSPIQQQAAPPAIAEVAIDAASPRIFGFLETGTGEQLAAALANEHSQTIAVVLANVEPAIAAVALAQFPGSQQADVARRIADLQPIDHDALLELQAALRESLGHRSPRRTIAYSGIEALKRIWDGATDSDKSALGQNLRTRERQLLSPPATRPASSPVNDAATAPPTAEATTATATRKQRPIAPSVSFAALAELDSASLSQVLRRAEGRTLLLALAGATSSFMEKVYRQLPKREAQLLRRQIEQQGPIVLRDVAEAQRRVAVIASQLVETGEIELPGARRFAMAA